MEKNKISHPESGTENLQHLTSNIVTLLPTSGLRFQIPWRELISIPLIMVMLRFTFHSFQLDLTLNLFQIHTPPRLNKFMMMKWTITWNSSTQNMMKIFWMLTSICFRLDCWFPLLKFLFSLYCVFS